MKPTDLEMLNWRPPLFESLLQQYIEAMEQCVDGFQEWMKAEEIRLDGSRIVWKELTEEFHELKAKLDKLQVETTALRDLYLRNQQKVCGFLHFQAKLLPPFLEAQFYLEQRLNVLEQIIKQLSEQLDVEVHEITLGTDKERHATLKEFMKAVGKSELTSTTTSSPPGHPSESPESASSSQ